MVAAGWARATPPFLRDLRRAKERIGRDPRRTTYKTGHLLSSKASSESTKGRGAMLRSTAAIDSYCVRCSGPVVDSPGSKRRAKPVWRSRRIGRSITGVVAGIECRTSCSAAHRGR